MTKETYKRAEKIQDEITTLERWFKYCDHISSVTMYVKRDRERDGTVDVSISKELSDTLKETIRERISTLQSEFESI